MKEEKKPVIFMLMSTLSLSVTGLLAKQLSDDLSVTMFSFLRFFTPALLLLVMLRFRNLNLPTIDTIKPILLRAFFIGMCQLCFIASLQTLTLVEGVVLFATGPLFMPIVERLFMRGQIRMSTIVALVMAFSGVVLLAGADGEFTWRVDLLLGLAGGLLNSGSQLTLYKASKSGLSPLEINFWTFGVAALLILPLVLVNDSSVLANSLSINTFETPNTALIFLMSLLIINTQVFRSKAYQLVSSGSQLAPLIFTNLLFTAVWQHVFFDDQMSHKQIFGISLIVLAVISNTCWVRFSEELELQKQRIRFTKNY
ncbi:EamA family transporter [Vibrio campbellii]|uniref:DMT family transporter n=1 Tax=Vibrio campbellii TaxID=680 RepID=UPI000971B65C|nr:DMT family transporter [Vibrio campbellii]APX09336.1 EamA family transporter [Vibrio campbellii]ARR08351.1 membrane protein [Vibrio campbellii]